jgi:hypothetical protein
MADALQLSRLFGRNRPDFLTKERFLQAIDRQIIDESLFKVFSCADRQFGVARSRVLLYPVDLNVSPPSACSVRGIGLA